MLIVSDVARGRADVRAGRGDDRSTARSRVAALLAFVTTAAGTAYRPSIVAMLPEIVGERDLAAANATEGLVENLSVVLGPAIGAGLLVARLDRRSRS